MKILVIQQKMIGDVLTSSILFRALREHYPQAVLHYLIHTHTYPVVAHNPDIDEFLLFSPEKEETAKGFLSLIKKIRVQHYDVVIDVYSKTNTALLSYLSGASERIGYKKWYTSFAYTQTFFPKTVSETKAGCAIESRMGLLQGLSPGFPREIKPRIYLIPEEKETAEDLLRKAGIRFGRPLIMCGILGSSAQKTYPLDYMARILDFIVEKTGAQLLFNYIPSQKEEARKVLDHCRPETKQQVLFGVFGKSLREFMAITSHCTALIGNEGGAVNMAKALDIPTFSIFSPQIKKENWSIYEDGKRNVSVHLADYHPEILKGIPKSKLAKKSGEFYELLEPNLIFASLEEFLYEHAPKQKRATE